MGDILTFGKKTQAPPPGRRLLMTIEIFETAANETETASFSRADGEAINLPDTISRLESMLLWMHQDLYERTKDDDDRLMLTNYIFASSRVKGRWLDDDILTPTSLSWLRRRFNDAYWSLDQRRSIAYLVRTLIRGAGDFLRQLNLKD